MEITGLFSNGEMNELKKKMKVKETNEAIWKTATMYAQTYYINVKTSSWCGITVLLYFRISGRKTIKQKHTIDIYVDRGQDAKQPLIFFGEGDQSTDAAPGDIIVRLDLEQHETFTRQGCDLHMEKTVSLTEALCGFQMIVRQLDGRSLLVTSPPGSVVHPGTVKCIKNEGMPIHQGLGNGNLYIKFDVAFPAKHFAPEADLKKIEQILNDRPQAEELPDEYEDVTLDDYIPSNASGGRGREAYECDEDDDDAPRGSQCTQQWMTSDQ